MLPEDDCAGMDLPFRRCLERSEFRAADPSLHRNPRDIADVARMPSFHEPERIDLAVVALHDHDNAAAHARRTGGVIIDADVIGALEKSPRSHDLRPESLRDVLGEARRRTPDLSAGREGRPSTA
jgi:hypothetical protein